MGNDQSTDGNPNAAAQAPATPKRAGEVSSAKKKPGAAKGPAIDGTISFKQQFTFGTELGKGGNATVMECTERATGIVYAVKLLEVGKPTLDLEQEVSMMRMMEGCPNAVQLKDVFLGTAFAYIIMDKFYGDVVHAMVDYISKNGKCGEGVIRPIFRQMVAAIAWLHNKELLHRDVKSDNYLLDTPDVADPKIKVVLSDMGTVCEHKPGTFLSSRVGTALYWSPEVVRKKYSYPADVWACGVICYSIMLGLFPFKGPEQLLSDAEPNFSRGGTTLSEKTQQYLRVVLTKAVKSRLTAQQTLDHDWLAQGKEESDNALSSGAPRVHANLATKVLNTRRRTATDLEKDIQQLEKNNLEGAVQAGTRSSGMDNDEPFETTEADGTVFNWEWWPESQLGGMLGSRKGIADTQNRRTVETAAYTPAKVVELLHRHGIDTSMYGKDKANTIDQMAKELARGDSKLLLEEEEDKTKPATLIRVVQVVLLRLRNVESGELLVETHLDMGDGRTKEVNRLLGTKMRPDENLKTAARRLIRDYLNMRSSDLRKFCKLHAAVAHGDDGAETVTLQCERLEEGPTLSPAYPGLNTIYLKYFLDGDVDPRPLPDSIKLRYGLDRPNGSFTLQSQLNDTRTWAWKTQTDCVNMGIATKGATKRPGKNLGNVKNEEWTEARVRVLLEKNKIDISQYGQGKALPVQKLVDEINSGEVTLLENHTADLSMEGDGVRVLDLCRVVNVVLVRLRMGDDRSGKGAHLLVEASHTLTDGRCIITNRLPATKLKSGETVWAAGRRLVDGKLGLKDADVNIRSGCEDIVDEEKESASFPGLKSVYRKHYIDAFLQGHHA